MQILSFNASAVELFLISPGIGGMGGIVGGEIVIT